MGDAADVVFIGTPPDTPHEDRQCRARCEPPARAHHREAALRARSRRAAPRFWERVKKAGIFAGVGYNHTLGRNTVVAEEILRSGLTGPVATISARTREHWGGIFKAHPWLSGPADSYLGFWQRGGGATGEHSHAHQHLAAFRPCAGRRQGGRSLRAPWTS